MFKQLMCGSDERLIDRFRVEMTEFFVTSGILRNCIDLTTHLHCH
jgi:hypothetical protein